MKKNVAIILCLTVLPSIGSTSELVLSRETYTDQLQGFWLGQCIGNWTGLVTEMDKIGGEGPHGKFYTREDWGGPDQPAIWGGGQPSPLSATLDFVFCEPDSIWGADDDTDIEFMYQHLLWTNKTTRLTGDQLRAGWLHHTWPDSETPFTNSDGEPENFLWVSNQRARDLMAEGFTPPETGNPSLNPHSDMIDAQLTTEIFGLFAPCHPEIALELAKIPIRTTARGNAQLAAEFYVIMHSLASKVDPNASPRDKIVWLAEEARKHLPTGSTPAAMYDFVWERHQAGIAWEQVRDELYQKYQVNQEDGYDITSKNLWCNGCFASGINYAASLVSLFYGKGDLRETIKIAALAGWDSDNPAATWGGLLGFLIGREGVEKAFGRTFSERFDIHRTRRNFPNGGIDNFPDMARRGIQIIDMVVEKEMGGTVDVIRNSWIIPRPQPGR